MKKPSAKTAQLSQFEIPPPQRRVVLLGASNLSLMFPTIVETARAMYAPPLEIVVAKGFGRSYGQQSRFFGKKFPGILQSGLWDAIDRAPALPTAAVIADVGNDLAYEAPVERIVAWIDAALDRLQSRGAQVVLNNLPIESLRTVGASRYRVLRALFFPSSRLPRTELLSRAERLSDELARLAERRKTPIFSGSIDAYGLDPIHPRRAAAGAIWEAMLATLTTAAAAPPLVRPGAVIAWRLNQLKPQTWSQFGLARRAAQPAARFADGTTLALF